MVAPATVGTPPAERNGPVGFMPAFERGIFRPGGVGVVSRSGSLGTLICLNLVQA